MTILHDAQLVVSGTTFIGENIMTLQYGLSLSRGALAATAMAAALVSPAWAECGAEPVMGEVCWMAADFCPRQYAPADGSLLTISSNQALYSLIGNRFGGDGVVNFALPDLQGRAPVGMGQAIADTTMVSLGGKVGTASVQLTSSHLPQHVHSAALDGVPVSGTLTASTTPSSSSPAGKVPATLVGGRANATPYAGSYDGATLAADAVEASIEAGPPRQSSVSGGNQPFNVEAPRLGLTACIATQGIYPPRS
ncbi:tail fiber protein [Halomonas coralii]|uniref:phage tail protein n=1 Tax=Modicisalibacter sp. R2A 31.J TaxID=2831898 RepID=UPI001CCE700C|nr:tail fiber protein [Modicisalibacter sp. R2A 31.J]MBZ9557597.1 tail fiber protein [Modicisalibacter sp. R2A 31.J]